MLLLFDYDGVIVDSFDLLLDLCTRAQRSVGLGRLPLAEDFRTIQNLTFEDVGRRIGLPETRIADYVRTVFELQKAHWRVRPFPDVVRALSQLATQHTLAVITSSEGQTVAAALKEFGLGGSISTVLGGETGISKAQRITNMQSAHLSPSDETFMVGDAVSDVRAGKQAGVRTVAVSWGYQDRELLSREEPDYLIDRPAELLAVAAAVQRKNSEDE